MSDLTCDPKRQHWASGTGIYVRAKSGRGWVTVDIAELDRDSLLRWLRQDGGENRVAENVVGVLLRHGHLHDPP